MESQARFVHLQELKPCFAFLVHPFNVNVVGDDCLVHQLFVTNTYAVEIKLTKTQEYLALKMFCQYHSIQVISDNRFKKVNTQN